MFWYNVISHNSSYYFKMYISEITKFPCQLHYYELSSKKKRDYLQHLAIYPLLNEDSVPNSIFFNLFTYLFYFWLH